jgi:hypothetical protein
MLFGEPDIVNPDLEAAILAVPEAVTPSRVST